MAIEYTMTLEGKTLVVVASGNSYTFADVTDFGLAVIDAAARTGCSCVLCLETELEYHLDTTDLFEHAALIASKAPHVARVAIVHNPRYASDAAFWENVAVNRGLLARTFATRDLAERWLYGQPPDPPADTP